MHDIKKIRALPQEFDISLSMRDLPANSDLILKLDKERRRNIGALEDLQYKVNSLSKEFGEKKASEKSSDLSDIKNKIQKYKDD